MTTISYSTISQAPFPVLSTASHRSDRGPPSPTGKPNAHPYAIKTTSSALLTRSNSTNTPVHSAHFYVPTSTSPSSKHRYSRSDTDAAAATSPSPRPLPVPPSPQSPTKSSRIPGTFLSADEIQAPTWRTKRAETLPTLPQSPPIKLEDLPSNPKAWTFSQLSSYLTTALRVRSGDSLPLPVPVARDITNFVKDAKLDGRTFLRLTESDLEQMGVNNLWRNALLNASRNLRQNVLKGQIWGLEAHSEPSDGKPMYNNDYYNSSSSSVDLPGSLDTTPGKSTRSGRVKGMVATYERSSSCSSRGSASESDHIREATPWADEDVARSDCEGDNEDRGRKADRQSEGELLFGSPASTNSDQSLGPITPVTPDVDSIQEIPSELDGNEPSIQELLDSSVNKSDSWGAKAWEDIDLAAGVTVKRITEPDGGVRQMEEALTGLLPGHKTLFVKGMSIGRSASKTESRKNLGDLFSRPLPTPPLPSLEEAKDALTIVLETSIDDHKPDIVEELKLDENVAKPVEDESLLEDYKTRVLQLETRLKEMEASDAQRVLEYKSQSVQTEVPSPGPQCQAVDTSDLNPQILEVPNVEEKGPRSLVLSTKEEPIEEGPRRKVEQVWRELTANDDNGWDPLDGGGLSSYVLMVGIGVCAIVLQTVLKRWASRRP